MNSAATAEDRPVLCVRCYNFCPTQVIIYMRKPHKPSRGTPYRRIAMSAV